MIALKVNGKSEEVAAAVADGDTPLLWVLRDTLRLTGTKFGCGVAACGACTVLVEESKDGRTKVEYKPRRSCSVPLSDVGGKSIVTIEGLFPAIADQLRPVAEAVQKAWIEHQVPQCGYCQSGMVMATVALLLDNPNPSDADIDHAITNICRCGTYPRIRQAIHAAAAGRK